MKKQHYRAMSTQNIKRIRRALTLCLRDLDLAVEKSTIFDESQLREAVSTDHGYFKRDQWPGRPSSKELDEMF